VIRIILLEKDEEYAAQLMDYMNQEKEFDFQVTVFTDPNMLNTKNLVEKTDVILANAVFAGVLELEALQMPVFWLTEEKSEEKEPSFFKYQSQEELCRLLYQKYRPKRKAVIHQKTQVIGFFSYEEPGAAKKFIQMLSSGFGTNKTILRIDMDPLCSADKGVQGYALSELFYCMKQEEEVSFEQMQEYIIQDKGVDILSGYAHWADACDAEEDMIQRLCSVLTESCRYDVIVINIGGLYPYTKGLMEACHTIFYLESSNGKSETGNGYYESFYRQLVFCKGQQLAEQIQKVSSCLEESKQQISAALEDNKYTG